MKMLAVFVALLAFALPASAHVVDAVFVEYETVDDEWVVGGVMDLAFVLPETRGVEDQGPLSRWELMRQDKAAHDRYRAETKRFIRERFEFRVDGEAIDYEVRLADPIIGGISQMPEDPEDIAFLTLQMVAPVQEGEMSVHWQDDLEAALIVSYMDPKMVWQVESIEPGGSLLLQAGDGGSARTGGDRFASWIDEGYRHVLPLGLDHAAFMIALFCIAGTLRRALWLSLAFTLAHGISLVLLVTGGLELPGKLVEIVIGVSIVWAGIEAWRGAQLRGRRLFLPVLGFGLLHGMGFGAILAEKVGDLSGAALILPMAGFNLGVELAQILLIIACALLTWLATRGWYRAAGVLVAAYGLMLVYERVF